MSITQQADNYLKNLNYLIQLENMGLNSWGDTKPREPNKNFIRPSVNDILNDDKGETINRELLKQEQLFNYLEKEKKPVIGPDGKQYKFNQATEPELSNTNDIEQEIQKLNEKIKDKEKELFDAYNYFENDKKNKINKLNEEIDFINQDINYIQNAIINHPDKNSKLLTFQLIDDLKTNIKSHFSKKAFVKIRENNTMTNEFITKLLQVLKNIKTSLQNEKLEPNEEEEITNIEKEIEILKDEKQYWESQLNIAKKNNIEQVKNYEEQLRTLNFGSFNMEKSPFETPEEYLERLTKNAQIPFDNSTSQTLSNVERNNDFKNNLKTLINDNSYVEQVLNYYRSNQLIEHYINTLNKFFPKFKDSFIKTFGTNNKIISKNPDEMIYLINEFAESNPSMIGGTFGPKLTLPEDVLNMNFNNTDSKLKKAYDLVTEQENKSLKILESAKKVDEAIKKILTDNDLQNMNDEYLIKKYNIEDSDSDIDIIDTSLNNDIINLGYNDEETKQGIVKKDDFKDDIDINRPIIRTENNKNENNIYDDYEILNKYNIRVLDEKTVNGSYVIRAAGGPILYIKYYTDFKLNNKKLDIGEYSNSKIKLTNRKFDYTNQTIDELQIFISHTEQDLSWYSLNLNNRGLNSFYTFLRNNLNIKAEDITKVFNVKYNDGSVFNKQTVLWFLRDYLKLEPSTDLNNKNLISLKKSFGENPTLLFGMGIKTNIPEYIKIGKIKLLYKKLLLKNVLSIQQMNGNKVAGFTNKVVSDDFVNLITKIMNNELFYDEDINKLKKGEDILFDKLLSVAQLYIKKKGSGVNSVQRAKENLLLIEGQLVSGNNNPSLKKELYNALFDLVILGALSEKQARQHYKDICNNYF